MTGQILSDDQVRRAVLARQASQNHDRISELEEAVSRLAIVRKQEERAYWCLIAALVALVIFLWVVR